MKLPAHVRRARLFTRRRNRLLEVVELFAHGECDAFALARSMDEYLEAKPTPRRKPRPKPRPSVEVVASRILDPHVARVIFGLESRK